MKFQRGTEGAWSIGQTPAKTNYCNPNQEVSIMKSRLSPLKHGVLCSLLTLFSACGGDDANATLPVTGQGGSSNPTGVGGTTSAVSTGGSSSTSTVLALNLGTAIDYVILAASGVSTVPPSAITGNIGVSPVAATYITGFSLIADTTNAYSTSSQVTGKVYAADYTPPTPSNLATAVGDMQLAFTDAAGRTPTVIELGGGNISGMTLAPGIYKWGTGVQIATDVTLAGKATDVWILQIAQELTMSSGAKIILSGGALSKNVFWQVAGLVDLGTTAHLEGVILSQTSITLRTGASVNGRLLAQTSVDMDTSTVVQPAP
jgi:hypothetical protein